MLDDALAGIRVIDFAQVAAGPVCGAMMADLGADVIKLESPAGDIGRRLGPPYIDGESASSTMSNRGKRSVVLDLKTAEGRATARKLIATADIVLESFRPGVMRRFGLDYESLKATQPRLIYIAISAYGQTGPWKDKPGVDGIVQGASGLMSVTGEPGAGPTKVSVPVVDMTTAFLATTAVLAALRKRDRTGEGQLLDIGMYGSAILLQQHSMVGYLVSGTPPERAGSAAPYASPNEAYPTADGWIMVAAYHPERWIALCDLLGEPELSRDPRFADLPERVANRPALFAALSAHFRRRTTAEWIQALEAADIICGPIASYDQVVASPQMAHMGWVTEMPHASGGTVPTIGFGLGRASGVAPIRRGAPAIGQHTAEILAELGIAPPGLSPSPPARGGRGSG